MIDRYKIKHVFEQEVLATNPADPCILDTHILERQRKIIVEKGGINAKINKYLNNPELTQGQGAEELESLLDKLEDLIGREFTKEERVQAISGKLEWLKETLTEVESKGLTVFFWDKKLNRPCLGRHMISGFLKASAEAIGHTVKREKGKVIGSISYTQSLINQHCRVEERFLTFDRDICRDTDGNPLYLQRSLRAETAQGPRVALVKSEMVEAGSSIEYHLKVMKGSAMTQEVLERLYSYGSMTGLGQWRNAGFGMFSYSLEKL